MNVDHELPIDDGTYIDSSIHNNLNYQNEVIDDEFDKSNFKMVSGIITNVNKNDSLDSIDEKFFMSEIKKNVENEELQCENRINYNIEDDFELEQSAIKKKKNDYIEKIKSNIKGFSKKLDNDTTYFENNDFQLNDDESKSFY